MIPTGPVRPKARPRPAFAYILACSKLCVLPAPPEERLYATRRPPQAYLLHSGHADTGFSTHMVRTPAGLCDVRLSSPIAIPTDAAKASRRPSFTSIAEGDTARITRTSINQR